MTSTEHILRNISNFEKKHDRVFLTSSFQTQSVALLHIIGSAKLDVPVIFLDTGYHFAETLDYRDELINLLGLNVINLRSDIPKSRQKDSHGRLLYASDPDYCCRLNKVAPLDYFIKDYDVWISGVRRDQTLHRKKLNEFEEGPDGIIKYHPMLDWSKEMVEEYIDEHNLPRHPLGKFSRQSIGCQPCTEISDEGRKASRWLGLNKTECGIHTF